MNLRNLVSVAFAALALTVATAAFAGPGCENHAKTDKAEATKTDNGEEAEAGEVSVDQLNVLLDGSKVAVLDANNDNFRKKEGKIPGATLLTHYNDYEAKELPASKDTTLVFYCSNLKCGASHKAAKKAVTLGYNDVKVLPVGLMGWKEAGKKTEDVVN